MASQIRDFQGVNMLCDIGNGTMNIMFINDRKPAADKMFTEKYGTHEKILWSTTAAALFVLTLTGCADNAPVQTEDRPQTATEIPAESTAPVESEIVLFSAGDELSAEDSTASGEPTASPEPDTSAPATTPAPQVATPEEAPTSAPAASAPQESPLSPLACMPPRA